jgi:hypothetical protein
MPFTAYVVRTGRSPAIFRVGRADVTCLAQAAHMAGALIRTDAARFVRYRWVGNARCVSAHFGISHAFASVFAQRGLCRGTVISAAFWPISEGSSDPEAHPVHKGSGSTRQSLVGRLSADDDAAYKLLM